MEGVLRLPDRRVRRQIRHLDGGTSWEITDACFGDAGAPAPFTVLWQFAPGCWIKRLAERRFRVCRADVAGGSGSQPRLARSETRRAGWRAASRDVETRRQGSRSRGLFPRDFGSGAGHPSCT
jgi:hypothetical protein